MTRFLIASIGVAAAFFVLAACGGSDQSADVGDGAALSSASWILTTAPADASDITDAKSNAREGDAIVLRGIIGGSKDPLSAESAVFRIVDANLFNRCTSEDDSCSTPWDYCCADPDELVSKSATVQVVDAAGNPVSQDPRSVGIEELDEVIVVGTVAPRPNEKVLTVRATGIHRVGG